MKSRAKAEQPTKGSKVGQKTRRKVMNSGGVGKNVKTEPMLLSGRSTVRSNINVKDFCQRNKVRREDLTRMTGYSPRSVAKWAAGDKPGPPAQKQLAELVRLFEALAEIMEPDYVCEWIKTSNDAFDGSTPLQVIERGEIDRLWRMIFIVETGEPL